METTDRFGFKIELKQDVIDFFDTQSIIILPDGTKYYKTNCILVRRPDGSYEIFNDEWDLIVKERNK